MINHNDIIVLILSTKDERYLSFKKAIENSWMREFSNKNIKCFFYEGGHSFNEISNNCIKLNVCDDLKFTSIKLLEAFKLITEQYPSTKVVYRTNLSSFIDVDVFLKFIEIKKISVDSYSGIIGKTNYFKELFYNNTILTHFFSFLPISKNIYFASGSGFFIGINNVSNILANPKKTNFIDDVMIGYNLNIKLHKDNSPLRFDIKENDNHKISKKEFTRLINENLLFHYRFKTNNRLNDSKLLFNFSNKYFREEYCTLN
jgi:hypothetical protein